MSINARLLFAAVVLASLVGHAALGASVSSYTVTDLGAGTATIASNGTVISPDGTTAYAFPFTDHALSDSQARAIIASLPAMTNAPIYSPMTYGNPANAFSYLLPATAYLNNQGLLVVTDSVGVYGHSSGAGSSVLTYQRQADGTFTQNYVSLWGSPYNGQSPGGGQIAQALGLNNLGQVLGVTSTLSSYFTRDFLIHDASSGVTTHLQDVMPGGWQIDQALALDNQGRILLTAFTFGFSFNPGKDFVSTEHSFLLTPDGLPIDPITVPEPTTLAMFAAGLLGVGLRRWRRGAICHTA